MNLSSSEVLRFLSGRLVYFVSVYSSLHGYSRRDTHRYAEHEELLAMLAERLCECNLSSDHRMGVVASSTVDSRARAGRLTFVECLERAEAEVALKGNADECTNDAVRSIEYVIAPAKESCARAQAMSVFGKQCRRDGAAAYGNGYGDTFKHVARISQHRRDDYTTCLLYTSPSPRDRQKSRMPSSA